MKRIVSILLCFSAAFAFVSCAKKPEVDITTSTTAQATTAATTLTTTTATTETSTETTTVSTTTPMPSTKADEAVPISVNEALDRLTEFYGAAYDVNASVKEDNIQYFKVTDKQGNLYARVEVNLKTSDAKETVEHSGEVNEFNLLV
jgi:hypothetical protein